MNRLRGLRGRLDPWAALLLGSIVTLTLVILLAMPGPWQKVVGIATRPSAAASARLPSLRFTVSAASAVDSVSASPDSARWNAVSGKDAASTP